MASSSDEFYDAESDTLENNEPIDLEKETEITSPKRPTTLAVNESR